MIELADMLDAGMFLAVRFLLDDSFARRRPAALRTMVARFGVPSLRVTIVHAKFFTLTNDTWHSSCRCSMNLNRNPRFEQFDISDDRGLHDYTLDIVDELFSRPAALEPGIDQGREQWREDIKALL